MTMNQSTSDHRESTLVSPPVGVPPTTVSVGYVVPPGSMHPPIGPPRSAQGTKLPIVAMAIGVVLVVVAAGALVVAITSRGTAAETDGRTDLAASVNPATPVEAPATAAAPAVVQPVAAPTPPSPAASSVAAPVVASTPAPAAIAEAPAAATPAVSSVNVSPAVIADRFDGYLAAGSGFDVAEFVDQWAYPIRDYYGNHGVSADVVADKAGKFFDKYRSITFTRVGLPQITHSSDVVRATAPFAFEYVNLDGTRTCGTNTLTITFERTVGLPISGVSERKGPEGC